MKRPCLIACFVMLACVLSAETGMARTWHVPGDAPTIQAGIDTAGVGDDVLVAPGTYFEHDIAMKSGVWVHSEQGPSATTVDAGGDGRIFDCAELVVSVVIEGFTLINGIAQGAEEHGTSGGGVRSVRSSIVIHDCVIANCGVTATGDGGGIAAWESDVQVVGCRVADCTAFMGGGIATGYGTATRIADCGVFRNDASSTCGGIGVMGGELTIIRCEAAENRAGFGCGGIGCYSPVLSIQDCLITGNVAAIAGNASALGVSHSSGSISGCTITGNDSLTEEECVGFSSCELGIELDRTIIAFNIGDALRCWYSQVTVHCCDVYGNSHGNDLCGDDLGGNFSEDPMFCDAEEGDYTLDGCSPCLPGNHPDGDDCGLIGALGQGCGATAIEETSWGRIKALYRR